MRVGRRLGLTFLTPEELSLSQKSQMDPLHQLSKVLKNSLQDSWAHPEPTVWLPNLELLSLERLGMWGEMGRGIKVGTEMSGFGDPSS